MTSWARSRAPSFMSSRPMWVLAVDRLTCRWEAISVLDRPSPTRVRTSHSRPVISSRAAAGRGRGAGRRDVPDPPVLGGDLRLCQRRPDLLGAGLDVGDIDECGPPGHRALLCPCFYGLKRSQPARLE